MPIWGDFLPDRDMKDVTGLNRCPLADQSDLNILRAGADANWRRNPGRDLRLREANPREQEPES
jgi:hypothetical protein